MSDGISPRGLAGEVFQASWERNACAASVQEDLALEEMGVKLRSRIPENILESVLILSVKRSNWITLEL